ncbi:MAG: alpha-hydroxy acid oxidase [Geminicoccaceae bacterium]
MTKKACFHSIEDAIACARKRLPRLIFDFIEGGADREIAVRRNVEALERVELQPRVLADVAERSLSTTILGQRFAVPFGIAPMGMCNVVDPEADRFITEMSETNDMPIGLSTAASTSIEDMAMLAGEQAWFQLYVTGAVEEALSLVERARQAGYETLILTGDVPQVSRRVRDLRNGFQMPFRIGSSQAIDFALHPAWTFRMWRAGAPSPANFVAGKDKNSFDRGASRAGANWSFLERLRKAWPKHLVLKGLMSAEDAAHAKRLGVDAIWVSNHGGRQLDSSPAPIKVLPKVKAAVGPDFPLIFDGGIRHGDDVVRAHALGADFVMLGRPILFAIGAARGEGLQCYLDILKDEISLVLAQIGCRSLDEVGPDVLVDPPAILTGLAKPDGAGTLDERRKDRRDA